MPPAPCIARSLAGVQGFLDELASARPLPAGGAAAAVSVALGASVGAMAAGISSCADAETRLLGLQRSAVRLAAEDCEAFSQVLAARGLPAPRGDELQSAWEWATRVPIAVAETAAHVTDELEALRATVRPSLSCDVGAARLLVLAGATASIANARANLTRIGRDDVRASLLERLDDAERAVTRHSRGT